MLIHCLISLAIGETMYSKRDIQLYWGGEERDPRVLLVSCVWLCGWLCAIPDGLELGSEPS